MAQKRIIKSLTAAAILSGVVMLLVWAFRESRKELALEQDRERPVAAPARVVTGNGMPVVLLDTATQAAGGIVAAGLPGGSYQEKLRAFATVTGGESGTGEGGVLLRVTLPREYRDRPAPQTAWLAGENDELVPVELVPSPREDDVLYYHPSGRPAGLVPGLELFAYLPAGPATRGVVVPSSAVVWYEGLAWVYVETSTGRFARVQIATDKPVGDGWLTGAGVNGRRVVLTGAQLLLSEELRSQIKVGD